MLFPRPTHANFAARPAASALFVRGVFVTPARKVGFRRCKGRRRSRAPGAFRRANRSSCATSPSTTSLTSCAPTLASQISYCFTLPSVSHLQTLVRDSTAQTAASRSRCGASAGCVLQFLAPSPGSSFSRQPAEPTSCLAQHHPAAACVTLRQLQPLLLLRCVRAHPCARHPPSPPPESEQSTGSLLQPASFTPGLLPSPHFPPFHQPRLS